MRGGEDARGARRGAACGEAPRPCRWTSEAVSLDNFGGVCVARCAARELARASVKRAPVKAGAWRGRVKVLGLYICS